MSKKALKTFAKNLGGMISRNSPSILTVAGVVGLVGTVIFAVKGTIRAIAEIEDVEIAQEQYGVDIIEPLSKMEIIKVTWRCYIPTAILGAATITCIIGSHSINSKRIEALGAVYGLTEHAFSRYKDKVVETLGERKEKLLRDEIAKEEVDNNPVSNNEVIFTNRGTTLCYDPASSRYFKSDIELLRKIENILNRRLIQEMYVPLNDLYDEIGIKHTTNGNLLGWNINDGQVEFSYSSILTEYDTPCLVLNFTVSPHYNFKNY